MNTPFRGAALAALATAAIIAATLTVATPQAQASEAPQSDTTVSPSITQSQFDQALVEAREQGLIERQGINGDGDLSTTVDAGQGIKLDFVEPRGSRLAAGSDGYGACVALNNFDQDAVISGGLFGVSAGLCVVSAGVFCVVAGAILTAAGLALSANNNQKCSGGRSLRVYPFSGHKPRCA
ncbi:hypothetical protein [Frondihabitans australicus]|uniref:Secreted protein n=1 Tax=Frondihabitans australicus TaxID=386892 RepID=A0A495ICD1_9MICO|nr:hypothetical protein [Frondihabitans australicus]RKR72961.1 hypothetical protein C8E83_0043 [Frondihabitans australicus]